MLTNWQDTIAAIASAPGGAARGIIRVSGPDSLACVGRLFPEVSERLRAVRTAEVLSAELPLDAARRVPCDVYVWPTDRSYTREPSAELHLIGSPPVLQIALAKLCEAGARVAGPGEFTLRAFLAGRIDLTQAEAVLGVIDADDRRHLDVALQQMAGGLARPLEALRERLLDLLAHLEAGLDFADEDIEFITAAELQHNVLKCRAAVQAIVEQMRERSLDKDLPRVVLRGAPNAGKSSLFNALLGRDAAIVSSREGTTRDYLTGELGIGGQWCLLIDTAGVDELSNHAIDRSAQHHAHGQARAADLEIICLDGARQVNNWERAMLETSLSTPRVVVRTKCDLPRDGAASNQGAIALSSTTGEGLVELRAAIAARLQQSGVEGPGAVAVTAARCRDILQQAAESLERAAGILESAGSEELIAAELRCALDALGRVVGAVYTDDILDRIFSRFCIGK